MKKMKKILKMRNKRLKKIIYLIMFVFLINNTNYANIYEVKNEVGPIIGMQNTIFDLGYIEEDGKKVISKDFEIMDIKKMENGDYNVKLHYSMPMSVDSNVVKKLQIGDVINIELSNNEDMRLVEKMSFEVVDKYLFQKPQYENRMEKKDKLFNEEIDFDNVYMYKMIEKNGKVNTFFYLPELDTQNKIEIYYDKYYGKYSVQCDYNVVFDKNVVYQSNKNYIKNVEDIINHNTVLDKIVFENNKIIKANVRVKNSGEIEKF